MTVLLTLGLFAILLVADLFANRKSRIAINGHSQQIYVTAAGPCMADGGEPIESSEPLDFSI